LLSHLLATAHKHGGKDRNPSSKESENKNTSTNDNHYHLHNQPVLLFMDFYAVVTGTLKYWNTQKLGHWGTGALPKKALPTQR